MRRADGPNQLWSWDITYLPTNVGGVCLYLYRVVVWSIAVQLLFECFDLPLVLGAELLELLLLGHRQHRLGVGILGGLPPTAHLLTKKTPLTAVCPVSTT